MAPGQSLAASRHSNRHLRSRSWTCRAYKAQKSLQLSDIRFSPAIASESRRPISAILQSSEISKKNISASYLDSVASTLVTWTWTMERSICFSTSSRVGVAQKKVSVLHQVTAVLLKVTDDVMMWINGGEHFSLRTYVWLTQLVFQAPGARLLWACWWNWVRWARWTSGIWDNEGRLQVLAASTCLTRRSMAHFGIHTAGMKKRTYSSSTNRTINIFHFNQQYLDDILVGWALVTPTQTMMKS